MFVLDALRRLKNGELTIPSFHLGHLGFRPGLEVESQYSDIKNSHGEVTGHQLTLSPFQGNRRDLFLFKCIFKEQPGVVARALSAFSYLELNLVSLESATIDRDLKHVLFCILSWHLSKYPEPMHLEEGTKHKFIDALPLLPTFDHRYILLLERFMANCFDAIEYEQVPGGSLCLPRISIKMFDDFYSPEKLRPVKIDRDLPKQISKEKFKLPRIKVDLLSGGSPRAPRKDAQALLFSETETKALHVIFPEPGREGRFLHIGFTHTNKPGALLLIATLLQYCGFSIKTSLLRLHEEPDTNVWELMVEHVVKNATNDIPFGRRGVEWFRDWCFGEENPRKKDAVELVPNLRNYNVRICRPTYPRRYEDKQEEFDLIDLTGAVVKHGSGVEVRDHLFLQGLTQMESARTSHEKGSWLATLIYPTLINRLDLLKGQVFLSIPAHCHLQIADIKAKFKAELKLDIITYERPDGSPLVTEALNKIRDADYFFGVWHHEKDKRGILSPWLPFEFGAAKAMCKRFHLIAHDSIPDESTRRIERDYALIRYGDEYESFNNAISRIVIACKRHWDLD